MTLTEAFAESRINDTRIRHRYFSSEEWITVKNNTITTEDGYKTTTFTFMSDRATPEWQDDWSTWKKQDPKIK